MPIANIMHFISKICLLSALATVSSCLWIGSQSGDEYHHLEYSVTTSSGSVQGVNHRSHADANQIVAWSDIPYAQPPLGELRWRAPRPLIAPDQIIQDRDNNACVQIASTFGGVEGEGVVGSEDCLYLDIKAPLDYADKKRPVMLWIHGGGNTTGLKDYYDFSTLVATQDVVVVTINYRLGALGWFTHPAIQDFQQGLDKTSNFGLLDIIQSLKWVGDNIQLFGGDPENITVFGESAGGHNVLALLASPLAEGLFHRAISQSGYTTSVSTDQAYNKSQFDPLIMRGAWQIAQKSLNEPAVQPSLTALREHLLTMPADEFIDLYYDFEQPQFDHIPLATNDGIAIPKQGILASLNDPTLSKNIPVIAGSTKDEVALWLGMHRYFVKQSYPFTRLLPPVYRLRNPELYKFWVSIRSQAWKLKAVDKVLNALQTAGYNDLYAYSFDWDHQKASFFIDFPEVIGAAHGTEIAFITGKYSFGPISSYIYPAGSKRQQMQDSMMSAWASFAKTGKPITGRPSSWQPFSGQNPLYLHLDIDSKLRLEVEGQSLSSLLEQLSVSSIPSEPQRCLILWEIFTNIENMDLSAYKHWDRGRCRKFDTMAYQAAMADELISAYGSLYIYQ